MLYIYIIKQNKFFIDDNFNLQILDFQKWMLKSGFYNSNLNDLVKIIKDVSIDFNITINKSEHNFMLVFIDCDMLIKYFAGNIKDLNDFVEIFKKNENFSSLCVNDLLELKKNLNFYCKKLFYLMCI